MLHLKYSNIAQFHHFFERNWRTQVLFVGPLIACIGLQVTYVPGFKATMGPLLACFLGCVQLIPQISLLVRHLLSPFTSSDCDVAATLLPNLNQLFWCCIVTPSDCDVAAMSLGNRFVSHSGVMSQRHRRRVAVARCKWALSQHCS